jgi:UDP-glucose 4-epimerase
MHNQVWNVGSNNPISINALANIIGGSRVHLPKRPGEPDITWADTSKIESDLNWKPIINFETGVAEILKNINYWGSAPLWDKKSIEDATKEWFKFMNHE